VPRRPASLASPRRAQPAIRRRALCLAYRRFVMLVASADPAPFAPAVTPAVIVTLVPIGIRGPDGPVRAGRYPTLAVTA
jgi:hypothetical protein